MTKFKLDKLVKDFIVPKSEAIGIKVDYKSLKGNEQAIFELLKKVVEESKELQKETDTTAIVKELIDIQLAIDEIIKNIKIAPQLFNILMDKRKKELGGFEELIYVHTMEMDETNPRYKYYKADPERFPEVE